MDAIKVERLIRITRQGGSISISPASSVYLLVPAEVRNVLKEDYKIDLVKDRKNTAIDVSLTEERSESHNPFEVKIVYSLRNLPKGIRKMVK